MSFTAAEGRRRVLDDLGQAVGELADALASVGEAYELVDARLADDIEEWLFRPISSAYGRARRTFSEFAGRYGLDAPAPREGSSGPHKADPRQYLVRTLEATERADAQISELQDSMLPVEVGDRELRDGLSATRELVAAVPARTRELLRGVGR